MLEQSFFKGYKYTLCIFGFYYMIVRQWNSHKVR